MMPRRRHAALLSTEAWGRRASGPRLPGRAERDGLARPKCLAPVLDLQDKLGQSDILVSHELLVIKDGQVLKQASAEPTLAAPKQGYTKPRRAAIPWGYRVAA